MPPENSPKPGKAVPPPRAEWLFGSSQVPNDQLAACVCWEYLREVQQTDMEPTLSDYAQHLFVKYRTDKNRRTFDDANGSIPRHIFGFLINHPDLELPLRPWQELDADLRRNLNQKLPKAWPPLVKVDVIAPGLKSWVLKLPPQEKLESSASSQKLNPQQSAFESAYMADRHSADASREGARVGVKVRRAILFEIRWRELSAGDPDFWFALFAANGFVAPGPFLINWAEYDSSEIIEAFKTWVHTTQPVLAPSLRGRGDKLDDLRANLRDLGAMRILKAMKQDEFERRDQDYELLWKSHGGRSDGVASLDLSKLRGQAVKFFQLHFALKGDQKPKSWQPRRPRGKRIIP